MNDERKTFIKNVVLEVFKNPKACKLPVPIKQVVRTYSNIRLISYSKYMSQFKLTYEELLKLFGTSDACSDYHVQHKQYVIYYNNLSESRNKSCRYRWNIAHELGHVLLKHHINNTKTRIYRSALNSADYNALEEEADYFASLILVPYAVLGNASSSPNALFIQKWCQVSKAAAGRRLQGYMMWRNHVNIEDKNDNAIFHHFYNFIFKKTCTICNASLIQRRGKYCIICGKNTLKWGDGTMIYKSTIELNENGKAIICPVCKNEEILDGDYCHICGTYIVNKCDDRGFHEYNDGSCGMILPATARYCPKCGNCSTFFNDKLLKSYKGYEKDNLPLGTGFMDIPDEEDEGLPFN